jgi:hypothetical protein
LPFQKLAENLRLGGWRQASLPREVSLFLHVMDSGLQVRSAVQVLFVLIKPRVDRLAWLLAAHEIRLESAFPDFCLHAHHLLLQKSLVPHVKVLL